MEENNNNNITGSVEEPVVNAVANIEEKPKKKGKGLKIVLIVIGSLVAICAIVIGILFITKRDYVKNTWAMMTKSDAEYLDYVVDRRLEKSKESRAAKAEETKDWKFPESFELKGNLGFDISKDLASLISNDFAGINNAAIDYEVVVNNGKNAGVLITPSYSGVDLISIGGAYSTPDKKLYVSVPSYKPQSIDLSSLIETSSDKIKELTDSVEKTAGQIDTDKIQEAVSKYVGENGTDFAEKFIKLVCGKIEDAKLEKGQEITVNGLTKKLNVINGTLSKEQFSQLITEFTSETSSLLSDILPALNTDSLDLSKLGNLSSGNVSDLLGSFSGNIDIKLEGSIYVDSEGNIVGGLFKLSFNETKIGFNVLCLPDEENSNKQKTAAELSVSGMKVLSFMNETEEVDGKTTFKAVIEPASLITSVVFQGKSYSLEISGSYNSIDSDPFEIDFKLAVKEGNNECASLTFNTTLKGGEAELPIDISAGNVVTPENLIDSGYVDLKRLINDLADKLKRINDDNFNNFLDDLLKNIDLDIDFSMIKKVLSTSAANSLIINALVERYDVSESIVTEALNSPIFEKIKNGSYDSSTLFSVESIKDLADSPAVLDMLEAVLKKEIKKKIGTNEPYQYNKLMEDPMTLDGEYVFSWDILKGEPIDLDNANFMVYDHFEKPQDYTVDLEAEKAAFIKQYEGQTFEAPVAAGDTIRMNDKIVFDAVVLMFGFPMTDYSYPGNTATVGKYEYGPGADNELIGMKVGDTADIQLTLDDRYGSYAGDTYTFRITVKEIKRDIEPDWSDAFIVGVLGYDSINACEDEIYTKALNSLPEPVEAPSLEEIKAVILDQMIKNFDISGYDKETRESFISYINKAGSTTYTDDYYDYMLALYGITSTICYQENWSLNDAELPAEYDKLAADLGFGSGQEIIDNYEIVLGERYFIDLVFENKAVNYLYSKTNIIWD